MRRMQSIGEEIANSITHGIGALISVAGLAVLVVLAAIQRDAYKIVSFALYGSSLVILYLSSTFYHSFQNPRVKKLFRIFDHSAIYLLIAGTYTPFLLITLRGSLGWSLLGILWGLSIAGIVFKSLFIHKFRILSTIVYLLMGWSGVVAIRPLTEALSRGALLLLAAGGLCYTVGVIFYAWKRLPYGHAIWHLFVMAGSVFHYCVVLRYLALR